MLTPDSEPRTDEEADYWATDDDLPEGFENAAVYEWWLEQPESRRRGGAR